MRHIVRTFTTDVSRNAFISASPLTQNVNEGGVASVTLTTTQQFTTPTFLHFTINPLGGAVAGVDYADVSSPIILPANTLSVVLNIPILTDAVVDPNEMLDVSFIAVVAM